MWTAYGVHLFSALGAIAGFLSLKATIDGHAAAALIWLLAAQIHDGIDGYIARAAQVRRYAPRIDGHALDLMMDYLTCVAAPAAVIYRFKLLPTGWAVPILLLIVVSGLLWMSLADLETDDGVFRGFPAGWNLVANSLWVVVLPGWASVAICLLFVALTFSNLPIAHPVQSRVYQPLTTIITATWMGVLIHMTALGRGEAPIGEQWLLVILPAWWLIIGYVRSTRLRREATPHSV